MDRVATIEQLSSAIASALDTLPDVDQLPAELEPLRSLIPPGFDVEVSLQYRKNSRKIRGNASSEYWQPAKVQAVISYVPRHEHVTASDQSDHGGKPASNPVRRGVDAKEPDESHLNNLLTALHEAESDPRRGFVALKWFRDQYLPSAGLPWTTDLRERSRLLRTATDRNLVLTSKVPNPTAPEHPTTVIRLNHSDPRIRDRFPAPPRPSPFNPTRIRGQALSRTVLADRR